MDDFGGCACAAPIHACHPRMNLKANTPLLRRTQPQTQICGRLHNRELPIRGISTPGIRSCKTQPPPP
jgi:hypothetical protein